jgi:hypothetical protein
MLAGVKVHVEPAGVAVEVRATVPVNPFTGATVIVKLQLEPTGAVHEAGLAATVKSWTTKVTVALAEFAPLVPVTVTVNVAAVADEQDSVDVPDVPVILVGLNVHVKPAGDTLLVSVTVPPAGLLTVIVEVPVAPALAVTDVGLAVRANPVPTFTVTVAVWVREPLVPVTVTVKLPAVDDVHESVEV